jgi:hypothetical protein
MSSDGGSDPIATMTGRSPDAGSVPEGGLRYTGLSGLSTSMRINVVMQARITTFVRIKAVRCRRRLGDA